MIVWQGASRLDGAPIVAIATAGSSNVKTGDMVQIFILRSDVEPVAASRAGLDRSVCGNCAQRHALGGGCYVTIFQAPQSVYAAYQRGSYADAAHIARMRRQLATKEIRFGAYGDPVAVPSGVWCDLLERGIGRWSGYTHQWRRSLASSYRGFLMASCDSIEDDADARARGWRTFTVVRNGAAPEASIECPAEYGATCATCCACDGTRFDTSSAERRNIWINAHGSRKARYASLPVVR